MFNRQYTSRTTRVRNFEFGGFRPKQEQNPILRSLKSALDLILYPSFYSTSETNRGIVSIVLIDQQQTITEELLQSFEKDDEVGFLFYTRIPDISKIENFYIQQKKTTSVIWNRLKEKLICV